MSFEDTVRTALHDTPFSDKLRRSVLKVLLGELQQKVAKGKFTDEQAHAVVKGLIKANEENLGFLTKDDSRYDVCEVENDILRSFLPKYWSAEKIAYTIVEGGLELKVAKSDGQAIGQAMKYLKEIGAPVEGDTVKQVVEQLRRT